MCTCRHVVFFAVCSSLLHLACHSSVAALAASSAEDDAAALVTVEAPLAFPCWLSPRDRFFSLLVFCDTELLACPTEVFCCVPPADVFAFATCCCCGFFLLDEKKSWIRLLFAGGRRTRGFLLLLEAWFEFERSRECSERKLWWLEDLGERMPLFVMLVVDESTCVIGLMGLILSLTEEILRLGTPLRFL